MKPCAGTLLAVLAAGCAVDGSRDVGRYRAIVDGGAPRAVALEPGATVDLRTAMRLANARSEELDIAGETYVRSVIERRRAASVFLPVVQLAPSYFLRDIRGGTQDGFDLPVSAALSTNPRGERAALERADAELRRGRAQLCAVQDALLLDVARTLLEVVRAERSAVVLLNASRVQDARVEDSRARRAAGVARPLDVSLSEARAAQTRVELLEEQRRAREGRIVLSFLTRAPLADAPLDGALEVPRDVAGVERSFERALALRPELAAAAAAWSAARRGVEVASGEFWPRVSVSLDVFLARGSAPTDQDWRSLLALNLPLFSAGRIRDDVRTALSFARSAQHELSLATRAVRRDVEIADENLHAVRERIAELQVQLAAARAAFDAAESSYDAGLATNLERLTAQDEALNAELELENAELDLRVAWLDRLRSTGELPALVGIARAPFGPAAEAHDAEAR